MSKVLEVNRDVLTKALSVVSGVCEKKNTMPILSYVHISMEGKQGTITGTDLETAIVYPIEGNAAKKADILLPGRKLFELIRSAQSDENKVVVETVQADKPEESTGWLQVNHARIATLPFDQYPKIPELPRKATSLKLPGITAALNRVMPAAGESDTRYTLNGVYFDFENSAVVATDGHRLHKVQYDFKAKHDNVIVPIGSARLLRGDKITAKIFKLNGCFECDEYAVITRFIEGAYPNWLNVVPKEHRVYVSANVKLFKELARECMPMARERGNAGRVTVKDGHLTVESQNPDLGFNKTSCAATIEGASEITFGINLRYLMDVLNEIDPDRTVTLKMTDSISPILVEDGDFLAIVMPLRM